MEQIFKTMVLFNIYFSFVLSIMFLGFMQVVSDNENKVAVIMAIAWALFLLPFLYIFSIAWS